VVLPSPEFLVYSIAYGSVLALLCIGLTLTYMVTKVPNFAHATLAITGATVTLFLLDRIYYSLHPVRCPGCTIQYVTLYLLAPILAFIIVGLVALAEYLLVLRPLARRGIGIIGLMIATLAFDMILYNALSLTLYITPAENLGRLIDAPLKGFDVGVTLAGVNTSFSRLLLPLVAVLLAVALHMFLTRTKFGVSLRASIENPNLARALGINVDLAYTVSWFLAGGLAGASGAIWAFMIESYKPETAYLIIVSIFAGSILGGLGSIYGALVGGFSIGLAETIGLVITQNLLQLPLNILGLTVTVTITQYQRFFSLIIVIVVLLIAPQGLAGINIRGLLARGGGLR
jgi:branched-chain amino acid transport system permease protein